MLPLLSPATALPALLSAAALILHRGPRSPICGERLPNGWRGWLPMILGCKLSANHGVVLRVLRLRVHARSRCLARGRGFWRLRPCLHATRSATVAGARIVVVVIVVAVVVVVVLFFRKKSQK